MMADPTNFTNYTCHMASLGRMAVVFAIFVCLTPPCHVTLVVAFSPLANGLSRLSTTAKDLCMSRPSNTQYGLCLWATLGGPGGQRTKLPTSCLSRTTNMCADKTNTASSLTESSRR